MGERVHFLDVFRQHLLPIAGATGTVIASGMARPRNGVPCSGGMKIGLIERQTVRIQGVPKRALEFLIARERCVISKIRIADRQPGSGIQRFGDQMGLTPREIWYRLLGQIRWKRRNRRAFGVKLSGQ